jgi:serine phosphatase RsbU (regulator of sigma subunit)
MPVLEIQLIAGPALAQRRWQIDDGFGIGRAPASGLALPDPAVSRHHALVRRDDDGWTLQDCHSRLGTHLNELRLDPGAPVALHVGDVLAIGPWRFRIDTTDSAAEPESAPSMGLGGRLGNLAEQRLELLLRCASEAASAADEQALADLLAEHALAGSGFARAVVLWRANGGLVVRSQRPVPQADADVFRYRESLLAAAAEHGVAGFDATADGSGRVVPPPIRRALCAPLMLDGRAEAFLYLDATRPARRGHTDAPTFVQALTRFAGLALANLRRLEGEREHAILSADLERAREVQQRLLPDMRPLGGVHYALHLHPGRAVAGDIVDVFALPTGGVAALLGDVSGAGLGAGLVMASVQSFLRAELAHHDDPARALARLNDHLCAQASGGRFVTLWLGIFDATDHSCRFVDAGHGLALHLHAGEAATPIATQGDIPLGIEANAHFHVETLWLAADAFVLLHSDGLTEQRAPDGTPFGRERLLAALCGAVRPADLLTRALAALAAHTMDAAPDDDTTVLVLGWAAGRGSPPVEPCAAAGRNSM